MPQVDYLLLADAAAAAEGKHYIHGAGWDVIFAPSFPVRHRLLAAAARLRFGWSETNLPHQIEVDIVDADGRSILPVPPGPPHGECTVGRPPHVPAGNDQTLPLVFNLVDVEFAKAGTYVLVLRLDGEDAAQASFSLSELPGAAPPVPGA